jgi:outer membrane protein OmpA-like peptidoglycan-associated protein
MNPHTLSRFLSVSASALGIVGTAGLTACANPPAPTKQLAVSKAALLNSQGASSGRQQNRRVEIVISDENGIIKPR